MSALARLAGQVRPCTGPQDLPLVCQRLALGGAGNRGEEVLDQRAIARYRFCTLRNHLYFTKHGIWRRCVEPGAVNPFRGQPVGRHRAHAPLVCRVGCKAGRGIGRRRELRHRYPCLRASRPVQQREGAVGWHRAAPCERRRRVADILHFQASRSTGRPHAHGHLVAGHRFDLSRATGRVRHLATYVTARYNGRRHAAALFVLDRLPCIRSAGIGIERTLLPFVGKRVRSRHAVQVRGRLHRGLRPLRNLQVGRLNEHRLQLQGGMFRRRDEQVRIRRQRLHAVLHGPHAPLVDRFRLQVLKHKLADTACSRGSLPYLRTAFAIENLELVGRLQASLFPRPSKIGSAGRDARCRQVGRSSGRKRADDPVAYRSIAPHCHHAAIPARSSRDRVVRHDTQRSAFFIRHILPTTAVIALPLVPLSALVIRYDGIRRGCERKGATVADDRRRARRGDRDLRRGKHGAVHPLGMRAALSQLTHITAQYRTHAPLVHCIRLQRLGI